MRKLKNFGSDRSGNTVLLFGLSFGILVLAAGGALEFNHANTQRQDMQDALDAAVLAGVQSSAMDATASKTFLNNVRKELNSAAQSYSSASSSTADSRESSTTLNGTATVATPTILLKLAGIDTIQLTVNSAATNTVQKGGRPCIYVLDPSGNQSLLVNSGATISAPECEIHVKSVANPAAIFNSGSSLDFKKICIAGANVIRNSTTVNKLELGCAAADDPYAGTLPVPASETCTHSNKNYNGATVNMTPGVYCGWTNFNNSNANVKFAPGLYVIKNGGWNVNGGTWTGDGVTFYFADTSKIQFNSGIAADLGAPAAGVYKDLLIYEKVGLAKSQFVLNDSVANKLTGLIWLPSRELTLNAKSGIQSDTVTIVTWRLILNNTAWSLKPQSAGSNTSASGGAGASKIRLIK